MYGHVGGLNEPFFSAFLPIFNGFVFAFGLAFVMLTGTVRELSEYFYYEYFPKTKYLIAGNVYSKKAAAVCVGKEPSEVPDLAKVLSSLHE